MALTNKQEKFVQEYLLTFNATQAAINSGYSKNTARQIGHRLLTNVDIKNAVDIELIKIQDPQRRLLISATEIAIKALLEEVKNGKGNARVNAANSILDRAGFSLRSQWAEEFRKTTTTQGGESREKSLAKFLEGLSAATGMPVSESVF